MEGVLTHAFWSPTGAPIEAFLPVARGRTRLVYRFLEPLLRRTDFALHQRVDSDTAAAGLRWPYHADTMVGAERLHNVRWCCEQVIEDGVPGDFVEAGVWRGGVTIQMRAVLAAHGITDRRVFVADSFAGLPPPSDPKDRESILDRYEYLAVPVEDVRENFARYDLLDDQVVFVEGLFKDTLPELESDSLAVMRLDGDMYESTMDGLVNLYDRLSPGGYCLIDDYAIEATRQAVTEFRDDHGIDDDIVKVDWTGVYWRKS